MVTIVMVIGVGCEKRCHGNYGGVHYLSTGNF